MLLFELYLSFLRIGFTSFGGMSMIPLILDEMTSHGWMTADDLSNLVAIAEMTPGPLGVNCATFTGTQTAGVLGGIVAVLGVLTPAFTLTLAAAVFFQKFRTSVVMTNIMQFVKPICIAMLFGVILTLLPQNYTSDGRIPSIFAVGIGLLAFYLLRKRKWTVPKVILLSAVLGLLGFGLFGAA